ncbi:hypothetical protein L227DRAFT_154257 [Lentinus tigrinus ALCF2SS1-6]|uniref:Uncharacterized protein n=1 Tax=Lentinus tigrinus ALCF2SS1-6 TaxID=1328759 RepID=A0A5C2S8R7_9APHY|nr:hypothetical protein L227DRAFT_154257 [Lentinus tigrinus ALCF2SS1-6]
MWAGQGDSACTRLHVVDRDLPPGRRAIWIRMAAAVQGLRIVDRETVFSPRPRRLNPPGPWQTAGASWKGAPPQAQWTAEQYAKLGDCVRSRVRRRRRGRCEGVADRVIDSSFPAGSGRRKGGDACAVRSRYSILDSGTDAGARRCQSWAWCASAIWYVRLFVGARVTGRGRVVIMVKGRGWRARAAKAEKRTRVQRVPSGSGESGIRYQESGEASWINERRGTAAQSEGGYHQAGVGARPSTSQLATCLTDGHRGNRTYWPCSSQHLLIMTVARWVPEVPQLAAGSS